MNMVPEVWAEEIQSKTWAFDQVALPVSVVKETIHHFKF